VLDDLAALGPFFAVSTHRPGIRPGPPWDSLRTLVEPGGPLTRRIDATRSALASRAGRPAEEIELRVAASITHLGLVARLIAPSIAAAATGHRLGIQPGEIWWQDTLGGPVPLSVAAPSRVVAADGPLEAQTLLDEVIAPLTLQTCRIINVSAHVLWGNVASAINGAAAQVAARRPDLSRASWATATALFASPRLSRERQSPGPAFRRSSCCLIYRISASHPQGICSDCILDRTN
jgi:FhuF 2Fe-2S C-terminal domain